MNVPTWPKIQRATHPLVYMRNGVGPSGPGVAGQAGGLLNHQPGPRFRLHFEKTIAASESVAPGTGANITTWRWLMRTMPNERRMQVHATMIPAGSGVNDHPRIRVKIIKDATAATIYDDVDPDGNNAEMWFNRRLATPTSAVLDDYQQVSQVYALEADTLYRCELVQQDLARITNLTAYGLPRSNLDPAVDVCVDSATFLSNQPTVEDQNLDYLSSLSTLWKRHGTAYGYSVPGTTAKTVTGTTETNIRDATTTWTSSTKGFKYPTLNKHSLETTLGTPTYAVPTQVWCYASAAAGTGTVRFRWGTTASDYIAITGITSAGWYKATGSIPGNADQKVDLTAFNSGANVTSVYAAGMFDYSA